MSSGARSRVAAVALVAAVAAMHGHSPESAAQASRPTASISIVYPRDGETIDGSPIVATGTVNRDLLIDGRRLVLLVSDPLGQVWVQPAVDEVREDGSWSGELYVGEARDRGLPFPVIAEIVDVPLTRGQILGSVPPPACAEGCQITISVVRG